MPDQRSVFLSYRRQETSHLAGRLADRLFERFGDERVFMDVDSIAPGRDFTEAIERALTECAVLLALIGPNWASAVDARGRRRLDDPDDLVVLEIKAALDRAIPVIPVLVDGAEAPTRDDLPATLGPLARRQALRIDHDSFRNDCAVLLQHVTRIMTEAGQQQTTTLAGQPGTVRNNIAADTALLGEQQAPPADTARHVPRSPAPRQQEQARQEEQHGPEPEADEAQRPVYEVEPEAQAHPDRQARVQPAAEKTEHPADPAAQPTHEKHGRAADQQGQLGARSSTVHAWRYIVVAALLVALAVVIVVKADFNGSDQSSYYDQLLSQLPANVRTTCSPRQTESPDMLASASCRSISDIVHAQFDLWQSPASAAAQLRGASVSTDDCASLPPTLGDYYSAKWFSSGRRGLLTCYRDPTFITLAGAREDSALVAKFSGYTQEGEQVHQKLLEFLATY